MRILVTGAEGQLGRELRDVLEQSRPGITDYVGHDALDITDSDAVTAFVQLNKYTHIINCAAYTAVDRAEEHVQECTSVNVDGARNLARAAAESNAQLVHISTDYVFDGMTWRPYSEEHTTNPLSVYGLTKLNGEKAVAEVCNNAVIIRTGWLYSAHGNNFVKTMLRLAQSRDKISVVADQTGTPTYALHLARAIAQIINSADWHAGVYHFANEGVATWYDFATAIMEISGYADTVTVLPIATEQYPTAATRPPFSVLAKEKIKTTYNITIPHWRVALTECLRRITINNNG